MAKTSGMKTSTKIWIGVAVVAVLLIFWLIAGYNNFVTLNQSVQKSWSEVENQYQTQADKLPNLVSTVSSAVGVETKFVKDVVAARNAWQSSKTDQNGAQMTATALTMINAVAEQYPVLQANAQYKALMDEISGIQNRIAVARGRYIESIQSMNTAVQSFPSNIIAGMFGFKQVEYYKAAAGTTTPSLGTGKLP